MGTPKFSKRVRNKIGHYGWKLFLWGYEYSEHGYLDALEKDNAFYIERAFIKDFCNDHNGEIRWLRGIANNEADLLKEILDWFKKKYAN